MRYRAIALASLPIAAIALLGPSLWLGTLPSNNSPQNVIWASQFSEQIRAGIMYPRWLPQSFDGLGSPTFYFYPPLPYWLDAIIDFLTFHRVAVDQRLSVDFVLLLWLSGVAMYAFLRALPVARGIAALGAFAYMAAPYHLFDHYVRGAYAEFAAFAAVPMVALGIRYVAIRHRFGPVLLATAYGALTLSHLPSALLVSISIVPGYIGYYAWLDKRMRLRFVAVCGLSLALGLALAAVYLVPALRLQLFISAEQLWNYRPEDSLLLIPPASGNSRDADFMVVLDSIAGGWCLAAVGALLLLRRQGCTPMRREGLLWAILALIALALMAGLVPFFWQIVPFVAKVQFPWRLLVVVEFAVITALCLAPWQATTLPIRMCFVGAFVALIPGLAYMAAGTVLRMDLKTRGEIPTPQDVKEYLPAGYPQKAGSTFTDLGLEPVKDLPAIVCMPAADLCTASEQRFGMLTLRVKSGHTTVVTVRRFYFPSWQLESQTPLSPTEPYRLISFTSSAGDHTYRLRRRALPEEAIGSVISMLALAILIGFWGVRMKKIPGSGWPSPAMRQLIEAGLKQRPKP